jgi:hypothetical protein
MEFVVHVLERFFQKNRDEATRIMLHVHRRGVGVCGVFTYEVADMAIGRDDLKVGTQIFVDRFGLGGRFNDDKIMRGQKLKILFISMPKIL